MSCSQSYRFDHLTLACSWWLRTFWFIFPGIWLCQAVTTFHLHVNFEYPSIRLSWQCIFSWFMQIAAWLSLLTSLGFCNFSICSVALLIYVVFTSDTLLTSFFEPWVFPLAFWFFTIRLCLHDLELCLGLKILFGDSQVFISRVFSIIVPEAKDFTCFVIILTEQCCSICFKYLYRQSFQILWDYQDLVEWHSDWLGLYLQASFSTSWFTTCILSIKHLLDLHWF